MSQRGVQVVIGRLVTDSDFRQRVERGGSAYLAGLRAQGVELNRAEIAALIGVDPRFWANLAKRIDLGLSSTQVTVEDDPPSIVHRLTARQHRVLSAICEGLRNKDIASQLGISESAVKATVQELFRKLAVRRRVQLVRIALDSSLVSADGQPELRHASSAAPRANHAAVPQGS